MSLRNLGHICSHIQNCSRARRPMAAVQHTKLHLAVAVGLYRHGMISHVQLGNTDGPDEVPVEITNENIAQRMIWLTFKYHDTDPVLQSAKLLSKPSKVVTAKLDRLRKLVKGIRCADIKGLEPSDLLFVRTDKGVLEAREALELGRGGQLLCRFTTLR
ncbi:ribosomal protein S8 [Lipomyces arxii]|uniref:ribosomal protein S8 n=1 Tax=Lipomyces arxii TaxID=56418 RepID=UPI0034CF67B9